MNLNRKKILPLALLAAGILILCLLLALLTAGGKDEAAGIALCNFSADDLDGLSYAGQNTEAALIKGSDGSWMLDSDPTLPLEQSTVQSLVESYVGLTAVRLLQGDELNGLPDRSDAPLMVFTYTASEKTLTLTVDSLNEVASVYYVYSSDGNVYTVAQNDLIGLCKAPRSLYAAQTLTDKEIADVAALQMNGLAFTQTDGTWTLTDEPDYPLDQSAVKKMVNTVLELQTDWTITAPDDDSAYGLDSPDVTATLTFTDGTALTVRLGALTPDDDTLCYLASSGAPGLVYEVNADHKAAFAVTRETLYDADATAETADEGADVIAEAPVGGENDYADSEK